MVKAGDLEKAMEAYRREQERCQVWIRKIKRKREYCDCCGRTTTHAKLKNGTWECIEHQNLQTMKEQDELFGVRYWE